MLSFRRLAVTTAAVATLAVPAAAQASPDVGGPNWDDNVPVSTTTDNAYGIPDPSVKYVPTSTTEVVEAGNGFEWGDAAIGGGAALVLTVVLGGAALTVRPRRAAAH